MFRYYQNGEADRLEDHIGIKTLRYVPIPFISNFGGLVCE